MDGYEVLEKIIFLFVGAFLGTGFSELKDWFSRRRSKKSQKERAEKLLSLIRKEINTGIGRVNTMVGQLEKGGVSLSRIYTGGWDVLMEELTHLSKPDTINKIHDIYYRFHLVNFHADHYNFETSHGFAKAIKPEIEQLLLELEEEFGQLMPQITNNQGTTQLR